MGVMNVLNAIATGSTISLGLFSGFPNSLYHTTAAMLGGDEYDLYHRPQVGRIYRLGLLFLVLITSATYTANLAAYLTKPQFKVLGPQTMRELERSKACFVWSAFADSARQYFLSDSQMVLPPDDIAASPVACSAWARDRLQNGECDAIVDGQPTAVAQALDHCSTMSLNQDIRFDYASVYHTMRQNDTELATRMSTVTLTLLGSKRYQEILKSSLGIGTSCDRESSTDDEDVGDQITVWQMSGVFIVFGGVGILSICAVTVQRMFNRGRPLHDEQDEVQNEKLDSKLDTLERKLDYLTNQLESTSGERRSEPRGSTPRGRRSLGIGEDDFMV